MRREDRRTCLLLLVGHALPLLRYEIKEVRVGQSGMLFLKFLANLVLEKNVGGGGPLGRVRILRFGIALPFLRAIVVGRVSLALTFDRVC